MSKPIFFSEKIRNELLEEFKKSLENMKSVNGGVSYIKRFDKKEKDRVVIEFTQQAFAKMFALVDHFDSEVAWNGIVTRETDKKFVVTDVLVYPQYVTGVTVKADQEQYDKWIASIPSEQFVNLHFHGHSHVNMATSPSSTDMTDRQAIIDQMSGDQFYIFMIVNKKREWSVAIYDFKNNKLYETSEIDLVCESSVNTDDFIKQSAELVKKTPEQTWSYMCRSDNKANDLFKSSYEGMTDDLLNWAREQ